MRIVVFLGLVLIASSAALWRYPQALKDGYSGMVESTERFWQDKEIRLSGLQVLSRSDILKELPFDESVLWWQMNRSEIISRLQRNPLIQKAQVRRCDGSSVRCFEVSIAERQPAFLALVGDRVWLLGEDGGFMTPVPRKEYERRGAAIVPGTRSPVIVEGIVDADLSPEVVKGRIQFVKNLISVVEPKISLSVERVSLRPNGEASLWFRSLAFEAVFASGGRDLDRLHEEAERLRAVLAQLGERRAQLERVDLGFDRVAVAKLRSDALQSGERGAELPKAAKSRKL
jgi:hypothetical protein